MSPSRTVCLNGMFLVVFQTIREVYDTREKDISGFWKHTQYLVNTAL